MTERQAEKLAHMLDAAFAYADRNKIFVTVTPTGIEIEGRHAVDLPRTYTTVEVEEKTRTTNNEGA